MHVYCGILALVLTAFMNSLAMTPAVYVQELSSQHDPEIVENVIDKDLDRTFPSHVLFQKAGSQGYGLWSVCVFRVVYV